MNKHACIHPIIKIANFLNHSKLSFTIKANSYLLFLNCKIIIIRKTRYNSNNNNNNNNNSNNLVAVVVNCYNNLCEWDICYVVVEERTRRG